MLNKLNSEGDAGAGRIEQLEGELERVRNAFEEYLSTTENLEIDVEKELHEMRKSLQRHKKRGTSKYELLTRIFCC
jgi:DNA repair exonuclease SbcCD ATPase subunit